MTRRVFSLPVNMPHVFLDYYVGEGGLMLTLECRDHDGFALDKTEYTTVEAVMEEARIWANSGVPVIWEHIASALRH